MVTHREICKVLNILAKTQGTSTMLQRMGVKYDPFKVLISTILSARARDEVTEVIAENLFAKYPTAEKLMNAKPDDVIKIIKKIGFYNAKSKNVIEASRMVVEQFEGKVPNIMTELLKLPGVGRKVANCVLVYAYKIPALPIDTHCHRIPNRLGWIKTKTPEETESALEKIVPKKHWGTINDTFVCHGKTTCLPVSPLCSKCPVSRYCKRVGVTHHR
ncbi:MAG TPA: endonuclease III [Candidatus Nanoarchaeia archaeon]|nr:endonuclease III [Candidatus Nanoarchaeia archaeon]